jgi:hypothetical protein
MSEILGTLFKYLLSLLGVAGVTLILYNVFAANKTQGAISDITQLQTGAQSLYNAQSSFTSLNNAVAIASKIAPTDMITGTALVNPWGGVVTVAVDTNPAEFDITETLVPNDACTQLASNLTSLLALKINGTAQTLPLDPGTAATTCTASNTMTFIYGH